ncbi:MAG: hypothetical protein ACFFAX_13205 [Promethearchaeota archaeon]
MKRSIKASAVISVIIVLLALQILSLPQERLLFNKDYTDIEFYPAYYFTSFAVASSDTNAELSFEFNIDSGENYTDCDTFWNLYHLPLEQFEVIFNITEVRGIMTGEEWDIDDLDAFWAGWFFGASSYPISESIPSGSYVLVFWIETDGPSTGWSATLTGFLRTRIVSWG